MVNVFFPVNYINFVSGDIHKGTQVTEKMLLKETFSSFEIFLKREFAKNNSNFNQVIYWHCIYFYLKLLSSKIDISSLLHTKKNINPFFKNKKISIFFPLSYVFNSLKMKDFVIERELISQQ